MATKTAKSKAPVMTNLKGQTLVCLRTLTEKNPSSLETYIKLGGYSALKRLVTEKVKATDVISEVKTSGLRGRNQYIYLTGSKGFHSAFFFFTAKAPMQHCNAQAC
jgi:NADH-quinone oxidoreductase subunit F